MNIVLIGFKSAGKSTVGKILAEKLNRFFIDVDDKIVEIYQQKNDEKLSVHQIYLKLGDAHFRALEKKAILALSALDNVIIATGGGSICDAENVEALKQNGEFVYLDAPKETVQKRILAEGKHPVKDFEKSFARRERIYQDVASLVINTENKTTEEIVKIIEEAFYGQ